MRTSGQLWQAPVEKGPMKFCIGELDDGEEIPRLLRAAPASLASKFSHDPPPHGVRMPDENVLNEGTVFATHGSIWHPRLRLCIFSDSTGKGDLLCCVAILGPNLPPSVCCHLTG